MTVTYQQSGRNAQPRTGKCISCLQCLNEDGACDMSLAQRVSEVPDAYEHGNLSTVRLLADAGYLEKPQSLTVGDVEEALCEDPNLAELWLERGRDQRLSGGWGIERDHDLYRVHSYSSGQSLVERDMLHACAEFIVRYVGFIHEVVTRHRR
jgi:hypothetical protein